LKLVEDAAGLREVEASVFINGIDILVTTPARLVDRIEEQSPITGLQSCSHLVLEKSGDLVESFPREMKILLETWSKKSKERRAGQLVALADRWNPDFSILCRTFKLAVVITNLMEAVVYSRFQVLTTFISSPTEESGEIINQMRSVVANANGSVVICCASSQVLPHISFILASYHQIVLKSTSLEELTRIWPFRKKTGSEDADRTLLIITDAALAVLTSANIVLPAQNLTLVHWDLPTGGRKAFERRFCLLRAAIPNIHLQPKETQHMTKVHLLLRPHDAQSLNTIMDFLRRSNSKVPEELEVFHSGTMFAREKRQQLCSKLVQTGQCLDWGQGRCSKRHTASSQDLSGSTLSGIVTFTVLRVATPVLFWVRLTQQQDDRRFGSDDGLALAMARFYSNPESRKVVKMVESGLFVAVEGGDGIVRRAQVQVLVFKQIGGGKQELERLEVFTVDEGQLEVVSPQEVYDLPESLSASAFPPAAVCLVIAGLKPRDGDTAWGNVTLNVSSVLHARKGEEAICRARVLLHLGTTVWVERVQLMVRQPSIASYVAKFDSAQDLVNEGWAVSNPQHMEALQVLAKQAGTALAFLNQSLGPMEQMMAGEEGGERQAFLPQAGKVAVYVTECITPEHFYVTKVGDVNSRRKLESELGAWALEKGYPVYTFNPSVGQVVMVELEEEEGKGWQRARVLAKLGAKQIGCAGDEAPRVEERLRVFCLDSGETLDVGGSEVGACPPSIATKIPFQAVRCSLAGWSDWGKNAGDELFEMTRDKATDEPLPLWCKVVETDRGSYRVTLDDDRVGGVGDLGDYLGKLGMATKDELDEVEECSFEEGWDAPCGLPDVLDMQQVLAATQAVGQTILSEEVEENLDLTVPTVQQSPPCDATPTTAAPLTLPRSLPELKIVKSRVNYKTRVPGVLWSQNSDSLLLTLDVAAMVDLRLDQVHLSLKGKDLQIEVVQVEEGSVSLHSTGVLTLWEEVKAEGTTVQVKGPKVQVTLSKAKASTWQKLVHQKFGWIQQDKIRLVEEIRLEEEEEEEVMVKEKQKLGFLEPFLARPSDGEGTPRYHPLTGETVMPEEAFLTDSSDVEDGEGEDDFPEQLVKLS